MDTGTPYSYPGLKTTILRWPPLESGMRVSPRFCPCFNTKSVRVQGKKSKQATFFLLPKGQRACPYCDCTASTFQGGSSVASKAAG